MTPGQPAEHQQRCEDCFESRFNSDDYNEDHTLAQCYCCKLKRIINLNPPCKEDSSSGQQDAGRQSPICDRCTSGEQEPFCIGCYYLKPHNQQVAQRERKLLEEIVDLIDGRYEGIKMFYETPSNERTGTDGEAKAAFEEVRIIKECVDIILDGTELGKTRKQQETLRQQQGGAGDEQR